MCNEKTRITENTTKVVDFTAYHLKLQDEILN